MTEHQRLKEVRQVLGLSQQQMGELVGLKQGSYSDIERGRAAPSALMLRTLLQQYGVNPAYVLAGVAPLFLDAGWAQGTDAGLRWCPLLRVAQQPSFIVLQAEPGWQHRLPQLRLSGLPGEGSSPWLAIEVQTDSMVPTIYPADTLVVQPLDPLEPISDNRIHVVVLHTGAFAVARLLDRRKAEGALLLKHDNRNQATYSLPWEQVFQVFRVHRRITAKLQGPDDLHARVTALEHAVWQLQQTAG